MTAAVVGARRGVSVRPVEEGEERRWDELMAAHHYLSFRRLVGEELKYVAERGGEWVALIGWGAAAFKCRARDRWIGWPPEQQWRRLRYVVNNQRFLMLPWASEPNLASQVLAQNVRRLSADYQARFGHPVVLCETFVDPRFQGTCYRAAGWQELGSTLGYRRNGGRYYYHGRPKKVFVRPLHAKSTEWLTAPFDPPQLLAGDRMKPPIDLNKAIDPERGLLSAIDRLPDFRKPRGIRHPLPALVALMACAIALGHRTPRAMAQWAEHLPQDSLRRLGFQLYGRHRHLVAPSKGTLYRTMANLDAGRLERVVAEWVAEQAPDPRVIAVDGKSMRGTRGGGPSGQAPPCHLLSAFAPESGVSLGQQRVDSKTNEITAFQPLMTSLGDISGCIVTADALHAQAPPCRFLVEEMHADYLFMVKENQPTLLHTLQTLPDEAWSEPYMEQDLTPSHGRLERRTIRVSSALQDSARFAGLGQVCRIEREVRHVRRCRDARGRRCRGCPRCESGLITVKQSYELAHGISSLEAGAADGRKLLCANRMHWGIENRSHHVRDVSFDEDRSRLRTHHSPQVLACLTNLIISVLRLLGGRLIPDAVRYLSFRPDRALRLLGIP